MALRVPEIFIVGTMKGGTTILYDYLCSHPLVLRGAQKELHYFSLFPDRDLDWYLNQFPDRPQGHMCVDASPTYFDVATMPTIPAYIKKAAPGSRIIVIVRDPVERAISHFQHFRLVSHATLFANINIDEFFSRPLERCFTYEEPTDFYFSQTLAFSIYEEKYSNYVRIFGRSNVLVLTNEGLRTKPQETMKAVFTHCGLEWSSSELFGTQRYLSGSQSLPIDPQVKARLESLLYPSYERFVRQSGISDSTR